MKLPLLGVPGIAVLAGLYALWLRYSPAALISLFGLALFSVFVGSIAWFVLKKGHSRSRRFNALAGALLGFIALWVQWVAWIAMSFDRGPALASLFATSGPVAWISFLGMLTDRLTQLEPDRFLVHWLPLLWAAEAITVVWLPAAIARLSAAEPYSEAASAWAIKDVEGELWWDCGMSSELRARLEQEGVAFLLAMPRAVDIAATVASQWWTVAVSGSKVTADPAARWLNVDIVIQTRAENGKVKTERSPIVADWVVTEAEYDQVAAHLLATQCVSTSTRLDWRTLIF